MILVSMGHQVIGQQPQPSPGRHFNKLARCCSFLSSPVTADLMYQPIFLVSGFVFKKWKWRGLLVAMRTAVAFHGIVDQDTPIA